MTSRPVADGPAGTPLAGPGDRPHLPPVQCSTTTTTSRRSARKAPLAWLPWLLLGLLAATLLAAALLTRAAGGGDGAATRGGGDATASAQRGGGVAEEGAALAAGGQDLLGVRADQIASLDGQRAAGTARVESVVADEGFWVGNDARQRVFVFLTPQARRSAGESGFQVRAGQNVSLEGTVKGSSAQFARAAGVTDAEGSRQLVEQGAYVEATEVRLAP